MTPKKKVTSVGLNRQIYIVKSAEEILKTTIAQTPIRPSTALFAVSTEAFYYPADAIRLAREACATIKQMVAPFPEVVATYSKLEKATFVAAGGKLAAITMVKCRVSPPRGNKVTQPSVDEFLACDPTSLDPLHQKNGEVKAETFKELLLTAIKQDEGLNVLGRTEESGKTTLNIAREGKEPLKIEILSWREFSKKPPDANPYNPPATTCASRWCCSCRPNKVHPTTPKMEHADEHTQRFMLRRNIREFLDMKYKEALDAYTPHPAWGGCLSLLFRRDTKEEYAKKVRARWEEDIRNKMYELSLQYAEAEHEAFSHFLLREDEDSGALLFMYPTTYPIGNLVNLLFKNMRMKPGRSIIAASIKFRWQKAPPEKVTSRSDQATSPVRWESLPRRGGHDTSCRSPSPPTPKRGQPFQTQEVPNPHLVAGPPMTGRLGNRSFRVVRPVGSKKVRASSAPPGGGGVTNS